MSTHTRCALCGSTFDAFAWGALDLLETLGSHVIVRHTLFWPAGATIEIRRCTCGRSLARKPLIPLGAFQERIERIRRLD